MMIGNGARYGKTLVRSFWNPQGRGNAEEITAGKHSATLTVGRLASRYA
jgi:hypothetical protein